MSLFWCIEAESTNFAKRYKKIMSGSGEPSGLSSLPEEEGLTYDGHIRYHHGYHHMSLCSVELTTCTGLTAPQCSRCHLRWIMYLPLDSSCCSLYSVRCQHRARSFTDKSLPVGCFYIWKLITRKTCSCELCSGQQVLGDLLETGSYGRC